MKTISISDLRQHWPQVEKTLRRESEMTITRNGRPVAKLIWVESIKPKRARKRWDPDEHMKWLKKIWGQEQVALVDKYIQADRDRLP